ncbi:hypothetical protein EYF80_053730 [Liparis tanakae]|uniref:Uncharacterized protein n=1 Tax=Liparis tanakae TaxID=230148 RepID=A0A4Z2F6W5_9TELE|nr:hypothetical protein EYF80_053730 [Liparis tanakae]
MLSLASSSRSSVCSTYFFKDQNALGFFLEKQRINGSLMTEGRATDPVQADAAEALREKTECEPPDVPRHGGGAVCPWPSSPGRSGRTGTCRMAMAWSGDAMKALSVEATTLARAKPPRPGGRTKLMENGFRSLVSFRRKAYLQRYHYIILEENSHSTRQINKHVSRIPLSRFEETAPPPRTRRAAHLLPMSAKAKAWTVLQSTLPGKRRLASLATDLLKARYRKRRCGRRLAYSTSVVVFPVPAGGQRGALRQGHMTSIVHLVT